MSLDSSFQLPVHSSVADALGQARLGSLTRARMQSDEAAAHEFEALLGTMLVKELRQSLPEGFFGQASGADTFNGWFDEVIGRQIASSGALDLAGMVKVSLEAKKNAAGTLPPGAATAGNGQP